MWIDDDGFRLILEVSFSRERVESDGDAFEVSLNAMEVCLEDFLDRQLSFLGDTDQSAEFLDEEVQSISDEFLISKGMFRRKLLREVVHCGSDFFQRNVMFSANSIQDVDFHQVHKREQLHGWIGYLNDRPREADTGRAAVVSSRHPISDCGTWNAQIMRGFHHAIRWDFTWIKVLINGSSLVLHGQNSTVDLSLLLVKWRVEVWGQTTDS